MITNYSFLKSENFIQKSLLKVLKIPASNVFCWRIFLAILYMLNLSVSWTPIFISYSATAIVYDITTERQAAFKLQFYMVWTQIQFNMSYHGRETGNFIVRESMHFCQPPGNFPQNNILRTVRTTYFEHIPLKCQLTTQLNIRGAFFKSYQNLRGRVW